MTAVASDASLLASILGDIAALVECESPSSDLDAVARSADVVARVGMQRLAVRPERIVIDGRSHLRWRWGDDQPRVLVLGHHDTVWPIGTLETHPCRVRDGVLRGPGCVDMKAGLVIAFHAIAGLPDRTGISLLITGDEELGSPSSRALIEREATGCDAVLVLESAADGGALKTERKGVSIYQVAVTGRAAHAGLAPETGVNAAIELAHQVLAVAALADPARGTTVTPTVLSAGSARNTVPARAELAVDVRVRESAEQTRVDDAIRALRPAVPGAAINVTRGPNRAPLESVASWALYDRAVALADELGLPPLARASVGGASDGNLTAGIGVPTLDGLGATGGGAHADDEHVDVTDLVGRTALVGALIADILRRPVFAGPPRSSAGGR
ncbi:M20 family metallopeptidase [Allobranchiibius sp. GilTou73]|uniref:M20 family metallopeptidase n=1 Tax=Allobranchiibius sp. GilTou73 TaxID=2904523 RepID=UPI001F2023A2|nr:M20 family metallopeptidase [Allobranchiibius sp. GilTou73]UIJ33717.1 M20 family metallopeptidase [Allobranchiibius sp. GilTou73]